MSPAEMSQLVEAILYEGYILYPYRPTSKKNSRERFTFGRVYPQDYSWDQNGAEPFLMQTECLVETTGPAPVLDVSVGFLHIMARELAGPLAEWRAAEMSCEILPGVEESHSVFQTWHEGVERKIELSGNALKSAGPDGPLAPQTKVFHFPATRVIESVRDHHGAAAATLVRRQQEIKGVVELNAIPVGPDLFRVTVRVLNQTPVPPKELSCADAVLMRTLAATHTILHITDGAFISLMAPPANLQSAAEQCRNIGTWPVLVGDEGKEERDTLLSSPIILYDYPKVAAQSLGSLFDGTEVDEILSLRILTLTDDEKCEMRLVDEQARRLLERTESLSEIEWLGMHGTMQGGLSPEQFFGTEPPLKEVAVGRAVIHIGDRVKVHPKSRADVMDIALNGETAMVETIEQDLEGRVHFAVVFEKDPGRDLGLLRQPGHRFFFGAEEVEPLEQGVR